MREADYRTGFSSFHPRWESFPFFREEYGEASQGDLPTGDLQTTRIGEGAKAECCRAERAPHMAARPAPPRPEAGLRFLAVMCSAVQRGLVHNGDRYDRPGPARAVYPNLT